MPPSPIQRFSDNTAMASPMNMSLYIPRVHSSLAKDDILQIFERLELGEIKRVDLIIPGMKHDPHKEIEEDITAPPDPLPLFNLCFIHYVSWNHDNETSRRFYDDVFVQDKEVRVKYDSDGHYFKVFKNKNPKPDEQYELEQAFKKQQVLIRSLKARCELLETIIKSAADVLNGREFLYNDLPYIVRKNGEIYELSE